MLIVSIFFYMSFYLIQIFLNKNSVSSIAVLSRFYNPQSILKLFSRLKEVTKLTRFNRLNMKSQWNYTVRRKLFIRAIF